MNWDQIISVNCKRHCMDSESVLAGGMNILKILYLNSNFLSIRFKHAFSIDKDLVIAALYMDNFSINVNNSYSVGSYWPAASLFIQNSLNQTRFTHFRSLILDSP